MWNSTKEKLEIDWVHIRKRIDELVERGLSDADRRKFEKDTLAWVKKQRKE